MSDQPRRPAVSMPASDRVFRGVSRTAALGVLAIMGAIGLFLAIRAVPALRVARWRFLTERLWQPDGHRFGVAALLVGTLLIGLVALVVAVPISIATALFVSEYAPKALQRPLISLVDLMAAVPSIVYGLWGFFYLQPRALGVARWLSEHFSFLPIFGIDEPDPAASTFTASTFIAGLVVSLMVVPICTSVMRQVFSQAPPGEREGAYALGATRWGMVRTVVLPFGRGGMIGGTMLGLGRALGETIAVVFIISPSFDGAGTLVHILQSGGNSISAHIALRYSESSNFGLSGLMAAGLILFLVTLVINSLASVVVSRSRSGSVTEI